MEKVFLDISNAVPYVKKQVDVKNVSESHLKSSST